MRLSFIKEHFKDVEGLNSYIYNDFFEPEMQFWTEVDCCLPFVDETLCFLLILNNNHT